VKAPFDNFNFLPEKASSEKALEIAELQHLTDLLYAQPSEMSAS
jgi:hypothetical protein